jgi:hypothetical protein
VVSCHCFNWSPLTTFFNFVLDWSSEISAQYLISTVFSPGQVMFAVLALALPIGINKMPSTRTPFNVDTCFCYQHMPLCFCCQHLRYEVGRHCVTLLTCPIHQGLQTQCLGSKQGFINPAKILSITPDCMSRKTANSIQSSAPLSVSITCFHH